MIFRDQGRNNFPAAIVFARFLICWRWSQAIDVEIMGKSALVPFFVWVKVTSCSWRSPKRLKSSHRLCQWAVLRTACLCSPKRGPIFVGFGAWLVGEIGAFLFVFVELSALVFITAGIAAPLSYGVFTAEGTMLARFPVSIFRGSLRLGVSWLRMTAIQPWR